VTDHPNNHTKEDLARLRTDLAQERSALANERTFSAWIRTGLTAVAAGLGIAKLIPITNLNWLTVLIGVLFVLAGILIFFLAIWRYYSAGKELRLRKGQTIPAWILSVLILMFLTGALLSLLILL